MRITVFGAGGPVAGAAIDALTRGRHSLALADLDESRLAAYQNQHPILRVDISDADAVLNAARGSDILLNCSVVRERYPAAFDVNCLGALNVMRAAQTMGIRKVIHTGPMCALTDDPGDWSNDHDVTEGSLSRPGTNLYFITKHLGQEVCRIFAERHGIQVIALLLCAIHDKRTTGTPVVIKGFDRAASLVELEDIGSAIVCAGECGPLPHVFESFFLVSDVPHRRLSSEKARQLLGWTPKEKLEWMYTR